LMSAGTGPAPTMTTSVSITFRIDRAFLLAGPGRHQCRRSAPIVACFWVAPETGAAFPMK
jgi:hypothetical protein